MNILLINHYAGSPDMGMEFRPYYMAREWVKAGHDVTIIAGDYSHLRIKNPDVQRDFQEEIIDGIRYVWVKTGEYEGNGSARAFTMFRFVRKLKAHAAALVRDYMPDVVIASSTYPLDTYAAQKMAKLANAKYVHEIHDMWPATLYEIGGMSKRHPFVMLMQAAENSFCKNADVVVSLLGRAKDYLVEHGMAPEKFVHIPNGVVEEEWENYERIPREHEELFSQLHDDGKFVVGHFGGHAIANGVDVILDVSKMVEAADIAFVLVGEGSETNRLKQRKVDEKLDSVFFLPRVPKTCIPDLLSNFDCVFISGVQSPLYRFGASPNKMYDAMMAGKPIIMFNRIEETPIEKFDCGIVLSEETVEQAAREVETLHNISQEQLAKMGRNGKRAARAEYVYSTLADRFFRALKSADKLTSAKF